MKKFPSPRPRLQSLLALVLAALAAFASSALAENWPGWRGPRGDGTSEEPAAPTSWSPTKNILWKTPIPGKGHASPIVWEDRVFTVTCLEESDERVLLCLDRISGRILWQRTVLKSPLEPLHRLNSRASSTPVTDGKLVYCTFLDREEMVVSAFDFEGKEVWTVRPGVFSSVHGYCANPVIHKQSLIVNGDHDGQSYIVSLDRATGKTIWKIDRENHVRSYSTPIIRTIDGRTQMILSGSKSVASYDPDNGKRHWVIDGPTEQFVASMVYNGKLLFMTCGYPERHMMAIRPDGKGNVTSTHIAWRMKGQLDCSYVPSPIAAGPYFLVVSDFGIASCIEADSGKRLWREKLDKSHSASLVSAGGLVYFLSDQGVMKVVRPGPTLQVVATSELGENCYTSPAISQGSIFIRGEKHLFRIGEKK